MFQLNIFLLHCDEWDRVVALPRHKFVTGATLLQCTQFHNRGKTQWTIKSFILQSSHIMILNSTMFGGNRTKDVEVGPDRQTGRFLYTPQTMFAGSIIN
jgi:hypothetical protein